MSNSGEILFMVCGLIAVIAATLTITLRNPLRSAVALLAHIIALAGLYLTLHAHLLAAIQLLVYAGAVVVLFVFVIMLIGPGAMSSRPDTSGWTVRTFGAGMLVLVAGAVMFSVSHTDVATTPLPACPDGVAECDQFGGVNALSHALFRDAAIPFELVSMLLLVAIVAAIAVASGRTAGEKDLIDSVEARRRAPRPFMNDAAGPTLNPNTPTRPTPGIAGSSVPDAGDAPAE